MKIETIFTKKRIGVKIGQVGIGLMMFPWIYVRWNEDYYYVSFWEWLICKPTFFFTVNNEKYIQFRFMWFIIQIFSAEK